MTEREAYERLLQRTLVFARFVGRIEGTVEVYRRFGESGMSTPLIDKIQESIDTFNTELKKLGDEQGMEQVCKGGPNVSY